MNLAGLGMTGGGSFLGAIGFNVDVDGCGAGALVVGVVGAFVGGFVVVVVVVVVLVFVVVVLELVGGVFTWNWTGLPSWKWI